MGKYQLDDKGKAQVARYHEKHSKGGVNKKIVLQICENNSYKKQRKNRRKSEVCMKLVSLSFYQGEKNGIKTTKIRR